MTEEVKLNGYLHVSTLLTTAINQAFVDGVTIDEVFSALKVQCEVTSVKLAQAVMFQQQREAYEGQKAAADAAVAANATDEGTNAEGPGA